MLICPQGLSSNHWREFHTPLAQGRMVHFHAAFGHDLFRIAVGNGVPDVEEYGEKDHVFWMMYALDINRHDRVPV